MSDESFVEAGRGAGVTGGSGLVDDEQESVAVAVNPELTDVLNVS
jgi:hypothetical protein